VSIVEATSEILGYTSYFKLHLRRRRRRRLCARLTRVILFRVCLFIF
jgi:hypothetical protein